MIDLARYDKLKKRSEELKDAATRAEGSLATHMATLEQEFGLTSKADAEAELTRLRAAETEAEEVYDRELAEFEKRWGNVL